MFFAGRFREISNGLIHSKNSGNPLAFSFIEYNRIVSFFLLCHQTGGLVVTRKIPIAQIVADTLPLFIALFLGQVALAAEVLDPDRHHRAE